MAEKKVYPRNVHPKGGPKAVSKNRCTARTKTCGKCGYRFLQGEPDDKCPECKFDRRCKRAALQGTTVCRLHGGKGVDIRLDEVMQWRANIFVGSGQIKEIKQVNIIDDPPWLNGWVWGDNFSIAAYDVTKEGAVQKCTTLRTRYLASGLSPAAWNISLSEGEKNALPCGETGSMMVD